MLRACCMYFRCLGVISESSKNETERYVKKEENTGMYVRLQLVIQFFQTFWSCD